MNYIIDTLGRTSLCGQNAHVFMNELSVCDCGQKIRDNYSNYSLSYSNYPTTEMQMLNEIKSLLLTILARMEDNNDKERSIV